MMQRQYQPDYPPRPRECGECGGELKIVYSRGEVYGNFKEKYRCRDCQNVGYCSGDTETQQPHEWTYSNICQNPTE